MLGGGQRPRQGTFGDDSITRFRLNYQNFQRQEQRPDICARARKTDMIWRYGRRVTSLSVIYDDIVHVRHLIASLKAEHLFDRPDDEITNTVRRMYALMAVMYGGTREPAMWLPVMDALLEDLAGMLVGHVDPKMETMTMYKVADVLQRLSPDRREDLRFVRSSEEAANENRARNLFAELCRWYHGAIIGMVVDVSPSRTPGVVEQQIIWYREMLKMHHDCGLPSCQNQIELHKMAWGVKVKTKGRRPGKSTAHTAFATAQDEEGHEQEAVYNEDEADIDEDAVDELAMLNDHDSQQVPSSATQAQVESNSDEGPKQKFRWTVSIAIRDARVGFPEER